MTIIPYIPIAISIGLIIAIPICLHSSKNENNNNFIINQHWSDWDYALSVWITVLIALFVVIFPIIRYDVVKNFASIIFNAIFSVINIFLSISNAKKIREHTQDGMVDFNKLEISNVFNDKNGKITFDCNLIADKHKTNDNHYILPEYLILYFCNNTMLFNKKVNFEKLAKENSEKHYIKFSIPVNNITDENTTPKMESLKFKFDCTGNSTDLNEFFKEECFFTDARMVIIQMKYAVAKKNKNKSFLKKYRQHENNLYFLLEKYDSNTYKYELK